MSAPVTLQAAKETLEGARPSSWQPLLLTPQAVCYELSRLLDTGLDRDTLALLVGLLESGIHPEALAAVVLELRREAAELKARPGRASETLSPLLTRAPRRPLLLRAAASSARRRRTCLA